MRKKLSQRASTSGIFTTELYPFPSTSWVYDMGCGTHIYITTRGLRGSKKLKPGALSLYVGDGHRVAVDAIGEFHFYSLLYKDGFVNRFENDNSISISKNSLIYFNAIPRDNIYEIVMSSSYTNDSSMFAKRIEKLHHDGLLNLTDIKSFEKCVACMSGKMAKKPYSHQVERAKDLLGLIHTDEVENQLGKTIKSLRFDHGGEYMSQEFLDHLRDHGIIAHRTPPYTPQHYGVLEKRNRTLLYMVRSMMRQTTLLKSFWDYALESAARILNMVPTKKVDKTPYEIWHGQAHEDTMGYSFYYPPENKVFVARNAEFFENDVIDHEASGSLEDLEIIQEEDTHPSLDTSLHHEEDD
ncbi:retrotransposon protein, putative, ty1-copia subclass [Tanacetum coccineum]